MRSSRRLRPLPSRAARDQSVAYLCTIGLTVLAREGVEGFVAGVAIRGGALLFDERASASNLLHEAGHVAICPGRFRHLLSGNVETSYAHVIREAQPHLNGDPDSPLQRALIQMGDTEATAWAFAAGVAAGLPPQIVIEDGDYQGEGAEIRACLRGRAYLGIHGLAHGGMTRLRGEAAYPAMQRWLQID